jgi:hypothetical protein
MLNIYGWTTNLLGYILTWPKEKPKQDIKGLSRDVFRSILTLTEAEPKNLALVSKD